MCYFGWMQRQQSCKKTVLPSSHLQANLTFHRDKFLFHPLSQLVIFYISNSGARLAVRITAALPNACVTFSIAFSDHRHMFPHLTSPDGEVVKGLVSYIPYSDGFNPEAHYLKKKKPGGSRRRRGHVQGART